MGKDIITWECTACHQHYIRIVRWGQDATKVARALVLEHFANHPRCEMAAKPQDAKEQQR